MGNTVHGRNLWENLRSIMIIPVFNSGKMSQQEKVRIILVGIYTSSVKINSLVCLSSLRLCNGQCLI